MNKYEKHYQNSKKILDFLIERNNEGFPPTIREICAATGLSSTSTVHTYLKKLENDGYITRNTGMNRGIKVNCVNGEKGISVPILGKVTAGLPILAVENIEGYICINESMVKGHELFALNVTGDSMINAGILDGDIAIFKKAQTAENGKIVVALLNDEATIKRLYCENGQCRLQPENPAYEPIISNEISVLGELITLVRYYK